MNFSLMALAFFAALNPARVRLGLPEDDDGRARPRPMALGIAVTFGLAALGVAVAGRLLDGLDVSPETFRVAAGAVMAVAAAWVLVRPERADEPELDGIWAGLVPITFPLLISPELFVLTLSTGADEPAGQVLGALAIALGVAFGLGILPRTPAVTSLLRAESRLLGAVLMIAAIALVISGIRDV